jgi:hypothetical protein
MSKPASYSPSLDESIEKRRSESDVERAPANPMTEKQTEDAAAAPATSAPEAISPYHPSQFPDGGTDAWLCLLGV